MRFLFAAFLVLVVSVPLVFAGSSSGSDTLDSSQDAKVIADPSSTETFQGTIENKSTSDCKIEVHLKEDGALPTWETIATIHPGNEWTMTPHTGDGLRLVRIESNSSDKADVSWDITW